MGICNKVKSSPHFANADVPTHRDLSFDSRKDNYWLKRV